jgi:hypothetical protein
MAEEKKNARLRRNLRQISVIFCPELSPKR